MQAKIANPDRRSDALGLGTGIERAAVFRNCMAAHGFADASTPAGRAALERATAAPIRQ